MSRYTRTHLSDAALMRRLDSSVARDRASTADLLADISEVDARRLYVAAGCSSMHVYCVEKLGFSDDAAYKRIQAARAARKFPVLFEAVADGRLHLTAVRLLAPHLTPENVDELVAAATRQRSCAIEEWLARRFPSSEIDVPPARIRVLPAASPVEPVASPVDPLFEAAAPSDPGASTDPVPQLAAGHVQVTSQDPPQERFLLQVALTKATHDKLRHLQGLLSHSVAPNDLAAILDRAFDVLIRECEKRKAAATERPREGKRPMARRTIPAAVRREVWARDEGRCTYRGPDGRRCTSRSLLEFDHIVPVALGGEATVDAIRLRCRAHNQLEAEQVFGKGLMERTRGSERVLQKASPRELGGMNGRTASGP